MRCWVPWLAVIALAGCGGRPPPPTRGVAEAAIGDWQFRRFQEVLDVEVWVADNQGVAYAGTYVKAAAERTGHLGDDDVCSVFVTRYERDTGIVRATVKFLRRLAQESGYRVEEDKVKGVRLVKITGNGETWAMWAAPGHVVKVGGRGRSSVPGNIVDYYGERYPSSLPVGVLEGPLPSGPDEVKPEGEPSEPYDPDRPTPDWKNYDPDKATPPATGR